MLERLLESRHYCSRGLVLNCHTAHARQSHVPGHLPRACLKLPDTNALCPFKTHRAWLSGFFSINRRQKRWCRTSWECMVTWLKMFQSWGLLTFSITIILKLQKEGGVKNNVKKTFLISKNETLQYCPISEMYHHQPRKSKLLQSI